MRPAAAGTAARLSGTTPANYYLAAIGRADTGALPRQLRGWLPGLLRVCPELFLLQRLELAV
eukprot:COSAG04_NODE_765_length_10500_cov_7.566869_5_plen_62_part_00